MTKPLLQGKIGYWSEGKLVYMPPKRQRNGQTVKHAHQVRNQKYKESKGSRKDRKRARKLSHKRDLCNWLREDEIQKQVLHLKNASKTGHSSHAFTALLKLTDAYGRKYDRNRFESMTLLLYSYDVEKRTPLYYAAHCGHPNLVEAYLSLFVLARVPKYNILKKIKGSDIVANSYTFKGWIERLGYVPGSDFGMRDFEDCVINALSLCVRNAMTVKKFSIREVISIANKTKTTNPHLASTVSEHIIWLERSFLVRAESAIRKVGKKKPLPSIQEEKGSELFDELETYWMDDDFDDDDNNYCEERSGLDCGNNTTAKELSDMDEADQETNVSWEYLSDVSASDCPKHGPEDYVSVSNTDFPTCQCKQYSDHREHVDHEGSSDNNDFFEASMKTCSGDDENATDFGDDSWGCADESNNESKTLWDVVSDVASVESVRTLKSVAMDEQHTKSYRDVLLQENTHEPRRMRKVERFTPLVRSKVVPVTEENVKFDYDQDLLVEEKYDAFFLREGTKETRGGRKKDMFRGNLRSPTHGRRGCTCYWCRSWELKRPYRTKERLKGEIY